MADSNPVLVCVDPDCIEDIWPQVRNFIAAAFAKDRGDDNADIVLSDLKSKAALLWVVWAAGEDSILAAVTTRLLKVPRGLVCRITACGGISLDRWRGLICDIEKYARAEGCYGVRIEGRRGWKAIFPDYREMWVALEKRL